MDNKKYRVLQIDNFNRESYNYPEIWISVPMYEGKAKEIARRLNYFNDGNDSDYYVVREENYIPRDFSPI